MASTPLSMVYRSDKQPRTLGQVLHDFFRNGEFCDIKLLVGTSQIQAHRVILAAFSPYFYQILQQNVSYLTLHNFDERAVRSVIDFCYTGMITVDTVSAEKLLPLANTLQIREVEKLCRTFLTAQQTLTAEMSPGRKQNFSRENRSGDENEIAQVESSGRFSPRTSPNVSTSGRPSSEAGSVDNAEMDVVTIKMETPEELPTDSYVPSRQRTHSEPKGREFLQRTGAVIDMSQAPTMHFRSSSYNRPLPPLQLISPRTDSTSASSSLDSTPQLRLVSPRNKSSLINHGPTPQLVLMSPQKESTSISCESTPQLVLMSAQKESPSSGCESTPQFKLQHKEESLLSYDSAPEICLSKVSFQHTIPKDVISQSLHTANSSVQSMTSPGREVGQPLNMTMCHICHQIFTSSESLKLHMIIHTQIPVKKISKHHRGIVESSKLLLTCGTCGKLFKDPQALKFHRYNHILRFPCNMCGRRFSRSWNLHRHKKTHYKSGEFSSAVSYSHDDDLSMHPPADSSHVMDTSTNLPSNSSHVMDASTNLPSDSSHVMDTSTNPPSDSSNVIDTAVDFKQLELEQENKNAECDKTDRKNFDEKNVAELLSGNE